MGRWDAGLNGLKAMHLGLREETQSPYRRRTGRCGLSGGSLSAFQMLDLQLFETFLNTCETHLVHQVFLARWYIHII